MTVKGQLSYKGMEKIVEATLLCDFYKISHRPAYKKGTEVIYSMLVPRNNKYLPMADKAVTFGVQAFVKKYLLEYFNENFFSRSKESVIKEYKRIIKFTLGDENPETEHIEKLHDLGYLPIKLSALKEGTESPMQVPVLTIENTDSEFYWLTNYLETLLSAEMWFPITSATTAKAYRKMLDGFALKSTGSTAGVEFQGHDFSMRGMSSLESAMSSGAAHLLSFVGTDTIPAIMYLEKYYNADVEKELIGNSIPAMEHSVMSSLTPADGDRDEYEAFKTLITETFPKGFVSIVSDTYDFFRVVTETLPRLKDEIMSRDGRLVIRPDSGFPVDILCGSENVIDLTNDKYVRTLEEVDYYFEDEVREEAASSSGKNMTGDDNYIKKFKYEGKYYQARYDVEYNRHDKTYYYVDEVKFRGIEEIEVTAKMKGLIECLWDTFGGTINEQGYKVLDGHIGAIYGDSMTYEVSKAVCEGLLAKGFASTNFVAGIGSYFYNYRTRDSLGMAMKATYSIVDGEEVFLFKDPKTDSGKRSLKGRAFVYEDEEGNIVVKDGLNKADEEKMAENYTNLLEPVFENGIILKEETLSGIRSRLNG